MYKEKHCLTFDFYLIAEPFYEKKPSDEGHPDAYRVFLFDSLWVQALRVLQLFEETLHIMYPSRTKSHLLIFSVLYLIKNYKVLCMKDSQCVRNVSHSLF